MRALLLLALLAGCAAPPRLDDALPDRWAGANAPELWAKPASEIAETLDAMVAHDLRVVRVCIRRCYDPATPVADVEEPLGSWHDEILDRIDNVIAEAERRRIRVIVTFRDGRNRNDAYAKLHAGAAFYADPAARAAYRRRIQHVLQHHGGHTNRAWTDLGPVLLAWDLLNQPDWRAAPDWVEELSAYVKIVDKRQRTLCGGVEFVTAGPSTAELFENSPSVDWWGYQYDPKEAVDDAADALARMLGARKKKWLLLGVGGPRTDLAALRKVYDAAFAAAARHRAPWLFSTLGKDRDEGSTDLFPGDLIFDTVVAPAVPRSR